MPFQSAILQPGINVERSLSLNEAGMSYSNLVRFKQGLIEKLGGWSYYYPSPISSTPVRDLAVFTSLRNQVLLGAASQTRLVVISTSAMLTDITPQTIDTNSTPLFSISSGSNVVTVNDPGSSMSVYGSIRLDTPISLSNLLLTEGAYPINSVIDSSTYTILVSANSCTSISSGGTLPSFAVTQNSNLADVFLPNHNFVAGSYYQFQAPTTIAGMVIQGPYFVFSVLDSTHAQIILTQQATATVPSSTPLSMNNGNVAIHHYMVIGSPSVGGLYGAGAYGAGLYNYGTQAPQGTGNTVSSSDWQLSVDWTALIANPRGDAIYVWAAEQSLTTAQPIIKGGAPLFCNGAFVSQPQQMMIAWGCQSIVTGIVDPLLVRWSDTANYNQWTPGTNNASGGFRIPNGAIIRGGLQAPLYMVFWTDIDVWIAQYVGQPLIWSFTRFGTNCGLIGAHAAGLLGGSIYWMGANNFFTIGPNGVMPMPCPVWDFVFQQIDFTNAGNIRCAPNTAFNEVSWHFPVKGSNGENSAYVKVHLEGNEYEWDFGLLDRSAWQDVSDAGMPIGADSHSNIIQHETSFDAAGGTPINAAVETGYFAIADGEEYAFIDFVIPDFIWGTYNNTTTGTMKLTFFATDFPGDVERVYGPYFVTKTGEYINTRIRGRLMRMRFESHDIGSFWRIGRLRYRWAPDGRR